MHPGAFDGFYPADFDLFAIPDFAGRMAEIRSRLRPRLAILAAELAPRLGGLVAGEIHPHVAQHMRRRVNPPAETWAAFCRDRRGYKRWTHFRVAVSGEGIRATVFVEDDADDKPRLADSLARHGAGLLTRLPLEVRWYTLDSPDRPTAATLREASRRLSRVKLEKFQAGIPLDRQDALAMSGAEFVEWAECRFALLEPLYRAGAG